MPDGLAELLASDDSEVAADSVVALDLGALVGPSPSVKLAAGNVGETGAGATGSVAVGSVASAVVSLIVHLFYYGFGLVLGYSGYVYSVFQLVE